MPSMELYVVYFNPSDYPGMYVVRRQVAGRGTVTPDRRPLGVSTTLDQVRCSLPPGLTLIPRHPDDDPCIVEVWA